MKQQLNDKISPYQLLNRWLYDGSKTTKLPTELEKDKTISHMYILYYFQCSSYNLVISKLLNNWDLFSLDRNEILYFLKQCVILCGYKPPFIQKIKDNKNKLCTILKYKYPFLKLEEINMMISIIDSSENKDNYYEMFGIYSPKKKKATKKQTDEFYKYVPNNNKKYNSDELMGNF